MLLLASFKGVAAFVEDNFKRDACIAISIFNSFDLFPRDGARDII